MVGIREARWGDMRHALLIGVAQFGSVGLEGANLRAFGASVTGSMVILTYPVLGGHEECCAALPVEPRQQLTLRSSRPS